MAEDEIVTAFQEMTTLNPLEHAHLIDWLEGRLNPAEAAEVAAAMTKADRETTELVAWLRGFLTTTSELHLVAPPQAWRETMRAEFAARTAGRKPPTLWQQLVASLSFDNQLQPALAGARKGVADPAAQQLVYEAGLADVALTIRPVANTDHWAIEGQVFAGDEWLDAVLALQLCLDGSELALRTADELGEFSFGPLPAGAYQLIICGPDQEILIDELNFGLASQG